jgi:outer membrane protein insertion porin family
LALTCERKAVKLRSLEHRVNRRPEVPGPVVPPPECRIPTHLARRTRPGIGFPATGLLVLLVGFAASRPLAAQASFRVVRQLKFEGNASIAKTTLAAAIGTTNSSWFATSPVVRWIGLGAKRYFDETEFRRDVLRLQVLYKRSGFPDVAVDTAVRRTDRDVYITFRIKEGRPIIINDLAINGLDSLPDRARDRLLLDLPLHKGDVFNRYFMQATADSLAARLKNRGFPEAAVYAGFVSSRDQYTADVTLDVAPGRRVRFGAVRVEGVERVDSSVIRDLLVARPGRPYSRDELFQSQRNLYKSDLVRSATVGIDSANYTTGDSVPILVRVGESPPFRLRAGVGYATTECFRTQANWTIRDFFGQGRVFDLSGNVSRIGVGRPFDFGFDKNICSVSREDSIGSARFNYQLAATVRRPAFLSPNNTLSVSAFAERRSEFRVYVRTDIGTTVELSRETPRRRYPVSLGYTISYGRTEATPASFCAFFNACTPDVIDQLQQRRLLAALTARVSRPRANSPIDPTRGSNASLEVTYASKVIGSSELEQFTRVLADMAWYRSLGRDVVLSWRLRGGLIFSPAVALGTQTNAFVPPEQRFYAGGPNDVRGFGRNELGPVVYVVTSTALASVATPDQLPADSVQVAPTGGNTLAVGNLELRLPSPIFPSRMRLAAFLDAGMLWERGQTDIAPARLRFTPGFGFRIATPLGPARLDIAYNPYTLLPGTLFKTDSSGALTKVQDAFSVDRRSRILGVPLTFQFSVGQPF